MRTEPLVSIIIPAYNRQELIVQSLESVKNQEYKNWECIIVDDGSSDNTVQTVSDWVVNDSRYQLFTRDRLPKGAASCRNIGVSNSRGEYLLFLDSDDLLAPYCLMQRVRVLKEEFCDAVIFPRLWYKAVPFDRDEYVNKASNEDHLTRFVSYDFPWSTTSPLWNKNSFLKLNGFREDSIGGAQDFELHVRALAEGYNFRIVENAKPDCFFRSHQNTRISNSMDEEKVKSKSRIYQDIIVLLKTKALLTKRRTDRLIGLVIQQVTAPLSVINKREFEYEWQIFKFLLDLPHWKCRGVDLYHLLYR